MGKFSIDALKSGRDNKPQTEAVNADKNPDDEVVVGAGFFENVGKKHIGQEVIFIPRNKIDKNPNNFYSISNIESLALSIRYNGLSEPLEVQKMPGDRYMLLGGERRITAIDSLIANPALADWTEDALISCTVRNPKDIELPLSAEKKEDFAIITTNKEARVYTDGDTYNEIQRWKGIIEELRENGVEEFKLTDEEENESTIRIKGAKTRDILAQTTGVSTGQISKFEEVDRKATQGLKEALFNNRISVAVAAKAAKELEPDEQDAFAEASREEAVTGRDVKKFKKAGENEEVITSSKFKRDIRKITKMLKEEEVLLDETQMEKYYSYIRQLENVLTNGK